MTPTVSAPLFNTVTMFVISFPPSYRFCCRQVASQRLRSRHHWWNHTVFSPQGLRACMLLLMNHLRVFLVDVCDTMAHCAGGQKLGSSTFFLIEFFDSFISCMFDSYHFQLTAQNQDRSQILVFLINFSHIFWPSSLKMNKCLSQFITATKVDDISPLHIFVMPSMLGAWIVIVFTGSISKS